MKVLKNISSVPVTTNSYGKIFTIPAKKSLTITHPNAEKIATELLNRFGFLQDITPKPEIYVETQNVPEQNRKGRTVIKVKKVVRVAKGVKKI